jgi:hypothetical protein
VPWLGSARRHPHNNTLTRAAAGTTLALKAVATRHGPPCPRHAPPRHATPREDWASRVREVTRQRLMEKPQQHRGALHRGRSLCAPGRVAAGNIARSANFIYEATIIHHLNTSYTNITATKAKPFPDGKQADILLLSITTVDNPAARNWHLDVTSANPMGVTNQELINRAALSQQPGPGEHDPRNKSQARKERGGAQARQVRRHLRRNRVDLLPSALGTTGGHGALTLASVYHRYLLLTPRKCATRLCQPADGGRAAG